MAKVQASKEPRPEEPKTQGPESLTALPCSNNLELVTKAQQEKKKDHWQQEQQQQP